MVGVHINHIDSLAFPWKRILRSSTHFALTNAFCAHQCILCSPMHFASTNAFCFHQRILRSPTHFAFNAFCVPQRILLSPKHFAFTKAFCAQRILRSPTHFAFPDAFCVGQSICLWPTHLSSTQTIKEQPRRGWRHSLLFMRSGRL